MAEASKLYPYKEQLSKRAFRSSCLATVTPWAQYQSSDLLLGGLITHISTKYLTLETQFSVVDSFQEKTELFQIGSKH